VKKFSLQNAETLLFGAWLLLLVPWIVVALLSGMAFDGGPTLKAYLFVSSAWTYPLAVGVVAIFRKRAPLVTLLPCLNLVAFFISGL
jgi:hypothetical protein